MLFALIAVGVVAIVWISSLAIAELREEEHPEWKALNAQRLSTEEALQKYTQSCTIPDRVHPTSSHPVSEEIWESIDKGELGEALALAEEAMALGRNNSEARLLLALTLLEQGDYDAASAQLQAGETLGAKGPFLDYLNSRVEVAQYLQSIAESAPQSDNAILMPVELLALELHLRLGDSNDAAALWMPGQDTEISQEEARSFVVAHFSGYYRLVGTLIKSSQQEACGDGHYFLARLALKCGFSKEGGSLLQSLKSQMSENRNYRRDLAILHGETPLTTQSVSASGKKKIKLNVLN